MRRRRRDAGWGIVSPARRNRSSKRSSIVFLDRDGTLIEEGDYLRDPRQVKVIPGAAGALRRLGRAGFPLVVLSNQSGVGRGLITARQLRAVRKRFEDLFRRRGIRFDGYYWCPHAPGDRCDCRKPKLGLVKRAARNLGRPWRRHVSIGDRRSDVQIGQRTGGLGILVTTGYGKSWRGRLGRVRPDAIVPDIGRAASWILRRHKKGIVG